jgi:hypothetical protein
MDKIFQKVKEVLLTPALAWESIKNEQETAAGIIKNYVLLLALIPALSAFIGYALIGIKVPFYGHVSSVEMGLNQAISMYVGYVVGIWLTGFVISKLAPSFQTKVSVDDAVKMVAYSYTPVFIAGIFYIIPSLSIIASIAGIYGLYILYLGFVPVTKVSEQKKTAYFVVSLLVLIVLFVLLSLIIGAILGAFGLAASKF